jgi:tetraacyldisaccharide 4'-kinase
VKNEKQTSAFTFHFSRFTFHVSLFTFHFSRFTLMFLPPFAKPVAWLAARLYELGVRGRLQLYERGLLTTYKLPAPVISVGNLTTGGTGKTPCTAYLARMLHDAGYRVAILSRGYKRTSKGLVEVSDGVRVLCDAATAGDEPYLLATQCPGVRVVVNADRYAAGMWLLQRAEVDGFLLDDGYQHLRLHRDLNLALVDAGEDLSQARLLPVGHWREPVEQLRRADAVIVTHTEQRVHCEPLTAQLKQYTASAIFYAKHLLTGLRRLPINQSQAIAAYRGRSVVAFTGIAQPEKFFAALESFGLRIAWRRAFADHYRYDQAEVRAIIMAAQKTGAAAVLTTEKDAANLPPDFFNATPDLPMLAAQLEFQVSEPEALRRMLLATVAHR